MVTWVWRAHDLAATTWRKGLQYRGRLTELDGDITSPDSCPKGDCSLGSPAMSWGGPEPANPEKAFWNASLNPKYLAPSPEILVM